ncbi:FeoB-associated Cys-rich membrane protein [Chryseobacterium sp. KACC 21268]|nr:FeoB-associated Cys-rich membrane protein [Chryseobacterium sp. KACC 21268]
MENSIIIQYAIIGFLVLGALYFIFKKFAKTFSKKDSKNCGPDCGCS